jgi:hypothetical protein
MSVTGAAWMHRSEAFAEDLLGLGALDGRDAAEATLATARRLPWRWPWRRRLMPSTGPSTGPAGYAPALAASAGGSAAGGFGATLAGPGAA